MTRREFLQVLPITLIRIQVVDFAAPDPRWMLYSWNRDRYIPVTLLDKKPLDIPAQRIWSSRWDWSGITPAINRQNPYPFVAVGRL